MFCNLLRTIWGNILSKWFTLKRNHRSTVSLKRARDKTSLLKKRRAAEGTVRASSPARAAVAVDRLQSGTIWSEEHSRDWKTENPWLDSWLCATRGWNSIRTPLVCTLVFFPLTLLSCFFFYKAKGLLVSGLWSRQGTFLRGGPGALSWHISVLHFLSPLPPLVPSLQPLQPHFPPSLNFSLTFSDSATSYLSVPTIPSSPVMPASVPLTQTHPGALIRPFAISPSLCSHSPSLCWASVCLVKTVESLTSVDACDFSQAPEGPRERVLCALTTWACKEGAGTVFLLQRFLAGCLTDIGAQCCFQVKDLGLEEETTLD